MKRETTCPECHRCGYHLCGCPEGERQWELEQMKADEESVFPEQFDPISEIANHFVSIYGNKTNG